MDSGTQVTVSVSVGSAELVGRAANIERVLIDIPSNWLLKIVGGGRYLPILAACWGIVGTCIGAVKSYAGLVACRLLLGACEGGMFGGIILYLSMFYKRHNLMFRLGVFYCAAPLSGYVASPYLYWKVQGVSCYTESVVVHLVVCLRLDCRR